MLKLQTKHLKILSMMVVTLIALQGCNNIPEPKVTYRIDKIPNVIVKINEYGGLYKKDTHKAFDLLAKLRSVEDYYYNNSTEVHTKSKVKELKELLYGAY